MMRIHPKEGVAALREFEQRRKTQTLEMYLIAQLYCFRAKMSYGWSTRCWKKRSKLELARLYLSAGLNLKARAHFGLTFLQ